MSRARAAAAVAVLALCASTSGGQTLQASEPGSTGPTPPSVRIERGVPITPAAADLHYQPQAETTHTDGLCRDYGQNSAICPGGQRPRAPEIVELARALRGGAETLSSPAAVREHVDLTYEYVRNRIDTEFLFGSHKGALGALIDGSGTAFDQADLMVQVLRESGVAADFVYGRLTLTGADIQAWTGLTRTDAVCDFLALGGIPFEVQGGCAGAGAPSTVTISHVWVRAAVDGQMLHFDPSFKRYLHTPGIDLRTAAQLGSSDALAWAGGGAGQPDAYGVQTASSFDYGVLADNLGAAAERLRQRLDDDDLAGASMIDVVGGRVLLSEARPANGWGAVTLPGRTAVVAWSGAQGIPDPFRARLTLLAERNGPTLQADFFTDEIYGRRLELEGLPDGLRTDALTAPWRPVLRLDGVDVFTGPANYGLASLHARLMIGADHPFAASAGAYGDGTAEKYVELLHTSAIVHGWGATSSELAAKWDREQGQDRTGYLYHAAPPSTDDQIASLSRSIGDLLRSRIAATWLAQFSMARDLHAELAESRAIHLHTLGVVSGNSHATPLPGSYGPDAGMAPGFTINDETTVVDLESSFGLVSRQGDAVRRRGAIHAIAATAATLEGSVVGQLTDSPDAMSTAARFAWSMRPQHASEGSVHETVSSAPRVVRRFPIGFTGSAEAYVLYDNGLEPPSAHGPSHRPLVPVTSDVANGLRNNLARSIERYASAGFDVVASSESNLGPGHIHGSEFAEWTLTRTASGVQSGYSFTVASIFCMQSPTFGGDIMDPCYTPIGPPQIAMPFSQLVSELTNGIGDADRTITGYARLPTLQRGGALIATRYGGTAAAPDQDDPRQIAHVLTRYGAPLKGGGAPAVTQGDRFDPSAAAQVLEDRFEDRSGALGVDLASGTVGFRSETLDSVGQGEFPYRLEHAIALRGGAVPIIPSEAGAPEPLVVSTLDGEARLGSSGLEAMGKSRPEAAASTLVAFLAMQDVWASPRSARREVAGVLVADWWADRVVGNVLTVFQGGDASQFVRVTDQLFRAAGGGAATAVLSAVRTAVRPLRVDPEERPQAGRLDPEDRQLESVNRMWTYAPLTSVRVTGEQGDWRTYVYEGEIAEGELLPLEGRREQFPLRSWTFLQGVRLQYVRSGSTLSVTSNAGPGITVPLAAGPERFTGPCHDPRILQSEVAGPSLDVANAAGETVRVAFAGARLRTPTQRPSGECRITRVYQPDDLLTPSVVYGYDSIGRVREARDAVAIRSPLERGPHRFFLADGYRGERVDPLGGRYAVEWMGPRQGATADRSLTRHIDELGRVTTSEQDGRGRPVRRTRPEGDTVAFQYDRLDRVTELRRIARPDPEGDDCASPNVSGTTLGRVACADLVVAATWNDQFNRPATIVETAPDGALRTTTFEYVTSNCGGDTPGSGCGQIRRVLRPAPAAGEDPPVYEFAYNALGQVTSAIVPGVSPVETRFIYDSGAHFLVRQETGWASLGLYRTFTNDARGRVTAACDPRPGSCVQYQYDAMGRVTRETRPHGSITETAYDRAGRPVEVRRWLAQGGSGVWQTTRTGYTPTGQVWWVQDPAGDTTLSLYDALDRAVRVTDPEGVATVFEFDAAGQLLTETRGVIPADCTPGQTPADPDCGEVHARFGYTPNGEQAWIKDGRRPFPAAEPTDNTATFRYDGHGRLMTTIWPDGPLSALVHETVAYGPSGDVVARRTREGLISRLDYDRLGRRTRERLMWTDGVATAVSRQSWRAQERTFQYDPGGRMTRATTAGYVRAWTYDTAGRVASHTNSGDPDSGSFAFGYDAAGNLTTIGHGQGLIFANYGYDLQNRMISANLAELGTVLGTASITYDTLGRRTAVGFGDGSSQGYVWEIDDDLTSIAHVFPALPAYNVTYGYAQDRAGRQTSEQISSGLYTIGSPGAGAVVYGAATAINTYPTVAGVQFHYADPTWRPNSPLSSDGAIHFDGWWRIYDGYGALVSSIRGVAPNDEYVYHHADALGRRYWTYGHQGSQGVRTGFYTYSDGVRPETVAEPVYSKTASASSWTLTGVRRWVLGPLPDERLIFRDTDGTIHYPHTDARGSTIALSRQPRPGVAAKVVAFAYDEFGQPRTADGIAGYPYRYTGQRLDPWTGTYDYKAREYSPRLGRFLQPDPMLFVDGPNVYAYVGNGPLSAVDPTGMHAQEAIDIYDRLVVQRGQSAEVVQGYADMGEQVAQAVRDDPWVVVDGIAVGVDIFLGGYTGESAAVIGGRRLLLEGLEEGAERAADDTAEAASSLLLPGPYARESVPATSPRARAAERRSIDDLGDAHGCHSCGARESGVPSGRWVPDHQPPSALSDGRPQILLPQCIRCSQIQGAAVRREAVRRRGRS